ncbi:hypothetical protein GCM10027031_24910 [Corynebacterium atrinae]
MLALPTLRIALHPPERKGFLGAPGSRREGAFRDGLTYSRGDAGRADGSELPIKALRSA